MKSKFQLFAIPLVALSLAAATAPLANAQITNQVVAKIDHPFVVGNTTLPPGRYTFRMEQNTDQTVMEVTNDRKDTSVQALVEQSRDNVTPKHTELVFDKFGDKEFLTKIYENGNPLGVRVIEPSHEEQQLQQQQHQTPQEIVEIVVL